jgi:hypothetical protein
MTRSDPTSITRLVVLGIGLPSPYRCVAENDCKGTGRESLVPCIEKKVYGDREDDSHDRFGDALSHQLPNVLRWPSDLRKA